MARGARHLMRLPLPPKRTLSERQMEILQLTAEGECSKAIAIRLGISTQTVKNHKTVIYRKLEVPSDLLAVIKAYRQGVVVLPELSELEERYPEFERWEG